MMNVKPLRPMSVGNASGIDAVRPIPYPAGTKAGGWRFELDGERIQQSDTWAVAGAANPAARPWLLMLWMTAWHQIPCGSMPSDPMLIAARLGLPTPLFEELRPVLLRGWWVAEDGRLYNDHIVSLVGEMITKKGAEAKRKSEWRASQEAARKLSQAAPGDAIPCHPSVPHLSAVCPAGQTWDSGVRDDTTTTTTTTSLTPTPPVELPPPAAAAHPATPPAAPVPAEASPPPLPPPGAAADKAKRGTRLPVDWKLPKLWGVWAVEKYPHWDRDVVLSIAEQFRDHWVAATGRDAAKLDWQATWRNWCRSAITQKAHPVPKTTAAAVSSVTAEAAALLGFTGNGAAPLLPGEVVA